MAVAQLSLEVVPRQRFELVDMREPVGAFDEDFRARYPRALYCSHHTTAGFLEQALCARLEHNRDRIERFLGVFGRIFPPGASYLHDEMSLRAELSDDQKVVEPKNADSHLAFIGAGLASCATYTHADERPVFLIDLDGLQRRRRATVIGYERETEVATLALRVPMSKAAVESVNLREEGVALFEQLEALARCHGVEHGRIDLALDPNEQHAGLTVNEYETLLMRHDLIDVLRNPFEFAAEKGRHILRDPLAVPRKTLDYATYDLVHVFNELMGVLGVRQSSLERLIGRVTGPAASRFLRLKRSIQLAVGDGGRVLRGQYQSPILVQWQNRGPARTLQATLVELH